MLFNPITIVCLQKIVADIILVAFDFPLYHVYKENCGHFYVEADVNSKRDIVDCTHRLLELMEKRATLLSDLERNTILSIYFKFKLQMLEWELDIMSQAAKIISREGLCTVFVKEA